MEEEYFNNNFDIDYLTQILEYNHNKYIAFQNELPFEENKEFEKILNARYHKVSSIKRRLIYLLSRYDYIWFCTFTFSDDYINKCNRSKRDLIKEVINTHDFKYILNVDYGKTTEREHYHCIIGTNWNMNVNQFIQLQYPCHCLAVQCKKGRGDFARLSKYINKLTNHCIKATTKRQRILYNFKGYDNFCPTSTDKRLAYFLDFLFLFEEKNLPLLDKGEISGKTLHKTLHFEEDNLLLPIIDIMLTSIMYKNKVYIYMYILFYFDLN